jgi:AcrR family transcriptional regulator
MTVNKVGRPSKAVRRRAQILEAMAVVVAREGLAEVTVGKVAEEAGLQRTLVFHYFGDRARLVETFIDEVVGRYGDLLLLRQPGRSMEELLDLAFADDLYERRDDLVVWVELVALAARDEAVRERVRRLWTERWLPQIEERLAEARPDAEPEQVASVAYGLICLNEAYWVFRLQGVESPEHTHQAKAAARVLLGSLDQADP